jgi:adenylate cyclase
MQSYRWIAWPTLFGALALFIAFTAWVFAPNSLRDMPRERVFDRVVPKILRHSPDRSGIVIVDIDRPALSAFGPWPRAQLARIVEAAASGRAAVVALDLLLAGPDRWTPSSSTWRWPKSSRHCGGELFRRTGQPRQYH